MCGNERWLRKTLVSLVLRSDPTPPPPAGVTGRGGFPTVAVVPNSACCQPGISFILINTRRLSPELYKRHHGNGLCHWSGD